MALRMISATAIAHQFLSVNTTTKASRVDTLALWVMLGTGALLARLAMRSVSFSGSPLGVGGQNPACVLAVVQGWDSSFPVR